MILRMKGSIICRHLPAGELRPGNLKWCWAISTPAGRCLIQRPFAASDSPPTIACCRIPCAAMRLSFVVLPTATRRSPSSSPAVPSMKKWFPQASLPSAISMQRATTAIWKSPSKRPMAPSIPLPSPTPAFRSCCAKAIFAIRSPRVKSATHFLPMIRG